MTRPRLTRAQHRALHLAYLIERATFRRENVRPAPVDGMPGACLVRHGYARQVGDGLVITPAGFVRARRALRAGS